MSLDAETVMFCLKMERDRAEFSLELSEDFPWSEAAKVDRLMFALANAAIARRVYKLR